MTTEKLREMIKGRVDWQFKGITNLLPSAYEDSKNMIADQVLQDCKEAGLMTEEEFMEKLQKGKDRKPPIRFPSPSPSTHRLRR